MATLNLQVAASSDDATEETTGSMYLTETLLYLNTQDRWSGIRLNNVTIPQGSTINSATLKISVGSATYDDAHFTVFCEDHDDAPTFTTATNDITNRTTTTASIEIDQDALGTGEHSFTITAAVQEVINRPGWVSGNDLVVPIRNDANANLRCYAYDYGPGTYPPKLDIDYTAPTGGAAVQMIDHKRRRI